MKIMAKLNREFIDKVHCLKDNESHVEKTEVEIIGFSDHGAYVINTDKRIEFTYLEQLSDVVAIH